MTESRNDADDSTSRVMVDIETLSLSNDAAIVSIGAVEFGPGALGLTFSKSVDRDSCVDAGLTVDEDTLEWWRGQGDEAREQLEGGDYLRRSLEDFFEFVDGYDEVWANSPSFDLVILANAADAVGLSVPWEFYEERDFRTLKSLPQAPDADHDGVAHDALEDAKHQAHVAATTLKRLDAAAVGAER